MAGPPGGTPIDIDSPDSVNEPDAAASLPALGGQHERITALADQLDKADFVSSLRLLEACYHTQPRIGTATQLKGEFVRLSQRVATGFQGRALDALEAIPGGSHQFRLYANFFGLLGTNGPLPLHYSEYADQRARHENDPTFREFLDIFNHRLLSLYYRAIAEVDPSINQDRPTANTFNDMLGSIAGLLPPQARARDGMSDTGKLFYAGWMGGRSKSPEAIAGIVSEYFGVNATVREFVGGWLRLPASDKSCLSGQRGNFSLGQSSYIGHRVWSISHKFVLVIESLTWEQFSDFEPGGQRSAHLFDLVRNIIGDEWDWDLQLQFASGEVRPLKLDRSRVLGFSCFLGRSGVQESTQGYDTAEPIRQITVNKKTLQRSVAHNSANPASG